MGIQRSTFPLGLVKQYIQKQFKRLPKTRFLVQPSKSGDLFL